MAYNTRSIKKDVDGRPVPQYFNLTADDYEPLLGENGAARSVLYGPNGQPLSVIDNKLAVRAADLETLIGALNDSAVTNPANAASVIAALKGLLSVVGKEATLGQILLALGSLATESTLASLASSVAKEATLSGVKSAVDTLAETVSDGAAKVTLSGRKSAVEEVLPRAIRTSGIHDKTVRVPDGATAAVFMLYVHGRTGIFGSGEGASLEIVTSGFVSPQALHGYGASTQKRANPFSIHQIFIGLGLGSGDGEDKTWSSSAIVPCVLWPGGYIYARASISGTFAAGEGMDTEMRVAWIF